MALEVYFKTDIANVVKGNVLSCVLGAVSQGLSNVEFVRGALALAQAQCLGFGIDWQSVLIELQAQAQLQGWSSLLDAAQRQAIEAKG